MPRAEQEVKPTMRHEWKTPGGTFFCIDSESLSDRGPLGDEILRLAEQVQELRKAAKAEIAKAREGAFAEAAAVCREAGCVCEELSGAEYYPAADGPCRFCGEEHEGQCDLPQGFPAIQFFDMPVKALVEHDPRCPDALATRIEALAIGKEE